jgi:hypothetical protein
MTEQIKPDWFDEMTMALGRTQQNLMSMTVRCRHLEIAEQRARERAEILEELVMDVVVDLHEGVSASKIDYRIGKVMQKLEWGEND